MLACLASRQEYSASGPVWHASSAGCKGVFVKGRSPLLSNEDENMTYSGSQLALKWKKRALWHRVDLKGM